MAMTTPDTPDIDEDDDVDPSDFDIDPPTKSFTDEELRSLGITVDD